MKQKTEIKANDTDKTFATQVTNNQSDEEIYGSLLDKFLQRTRLKMRITGQHLLKCLTSWALTTLTASCVRR